MYSLQQQKDYNLTISMHTLLGEAKCFIRVYKTFSLSQNIYRNKTIWLDFVPKDFKPLNFLTRL